MKQTILDLLKPFIGDRSLYTYSVIGPAGLDDECKVFITLVFDRNYSSNMTERYEIDFGRESGTTVKRVQAPIQKRSRSVR